ncbi:MAG: type III-B CRISPR module RAMP protein Cmr6 [Acidobacteria bacterium]|nr:type III-B CRISPR module RAMP protein Cmr6 [Acidobacteriota bacterium]
MSPVCTTIDHERPDGDCSPALLFCRFHDYDCFHDEVRVVHGKTKHLKAFDHDESRRQSLKDMVEAIQRVGISRYEDWHRNYASALKDLSNMPTVTYTSKWRLIVGWGTNPALETGIALHHLLGFPLIPGSSVKGLLHHVAEMELMEESDAVPEAPNDPNDLAESPPANLLASIARARLVRAIFGSLFIERHKDKKNVEHGPKTPLNELRKWKKLIKDTGGDQEGSPWREVFADLSALTGTTATGGMLTCFDAVPSVSAMQNAKQCVVQPDILNPHYPNYYDHPENEAPTDDQGPRPICFLAVRPETPFEFSFRIASVPQALRLDDAAKERVRALSSWKTEKLREKIEGWLRQGLDLWGIGAKTAAGYGYFNVEVALTSVDDNNRTPNQPPPETPQKRAERLLPPTLTPGELPSRLERLFRESHEVQAEVVRLLRQHYAGEIRQWRRKTAKKPGVLKRIEWLDGFPD